MKEIECKVKGRVQMVMFRDFVKRKAIRFNLKGIVKNLENGSVLIIAQGPKGDLEVFLKIIEKGSLASRINSIEVDWREPGEQYESFEIKYG
jgi:acylphosphatase